MKYTKLQVMMGDALDRQPDSTDVTNAIEVTAAWFEILLKEMGVQPSSIPTLLRWQYLQCQYVDD